MGDELEDAGHKAEEGLKGVGTASGRLTLEIRKVSKEGQKTGDDLEEAGKKGEESMKRGEHAARSWGKTLWKAAHDAIEGFTGLDVSIRGVGRSLGELNRKWEGFKKGTGVALMAGSIATGAALGGDVRAAGHQQSQLVAIGALARSDTRARGIYNTVDEMSTDSAYNLDELVQSAKSLTASGIFSKRITTATDDAAAANFDDGVTPYDVAKALGRLKSGDFGEGFERLRDFKISRPDLEAQGLKFSSSNQFQGTAEEAVEGVTRAIEKKFGGLSKRIATETMEGALSNLDDAWTRLKVSIGQELVPVITLGVRAITGVVSALNELPRPMKFCIAWGAVLASGLMAIGAGILLLGGTILKTIMIWRVLSFVCNLAGTSVWKLAWTVLSKLVPAMFSGGMAVLGFVGTAVAALALIAVAAAGFYAAIKGSADASSQSAYELQQHWGALGTFWAKAGDALTAIWNHPLLKALRTALNPGGSLIGRAMGLDSDTSGGDDAERKRYELEKKGWVRKGQRVKSFNEWKGGDPNSEEWTAPARPAATTPAATAPAAVVSPSTGAPMAFNIPGSGATSDIERLEDELAATDDKEKRKQIREQLRLSRRAQRHQRADEQEDAKADREQEKQRKNAARLADRQADADADVAEAQLNASLAARLAAMKRAGASKGEMAKVKASAELERARIRARGEGSDAMGASKAMRLGAAKAAGLNSLSEYADDSVPGGGRGNNQAHLNSMLAILRRGGSLQDLNRRGAVGGTESGSPGSGGAGGADNRTFTAKLSSNTYNAGQHTWTIKHDPIIVKDPYGRDAGML